MKKHTTYFSKLQRHNKFLFYTILLFCVFTVGFNLARQQVAPAFIWAMASEPIPIKDYYQIYEIRLDDSPLDYANQLTDPHRHILQSSLSYYHHYQENGEDFVRHFFKKKLGKHYAVPQLFLEAVTNDKEDFEAYPAWLMTYLRASLQRDFKKLEVVVLNVSYTSSAKVKVLDKYKIIDYEKND